MRSMKQEKKAEILDGKVIKHGSTSQDKKR